MRRIAGVVVSLILSLAGARDARAQEYLLGGSGGVASGIEGGGGGYGLMQRARTRLRIGVDARNNESPEDGIGAGLLLEIEPHTTVGADARYFRYLGPHFVVDIGLIGYLFPASILGATAGLEYRHPLGPKVSLAVGPEVNVFVFGSDLPSGTIIWQGLLQAGLHVDL